MRRCRSRSGDGSPGTEDKMPKHASSKWRQPFWFVVFVSFMLSFLLLFYLYRSSSLVNQRAVTFFADQPGYGYSHSVVDYGTIISDHFDNDRHDPDDADDEKPEKPEIDERATDDDVEIDRDDDVVEVTEEADKQETDEADDDDDGNDQDSVSETEDEEKSEIDEKTTTDDREIDRNSAAGNVSVRVTGEEDSVSATEGSEKHKLHEKNLTDQGSNTTTVEKLRINGTTTSNGTVMGHDSVSHSGKGFVSNGTVTGHDSVSHSGKGFVSNGTVTGYDSVSHSGKGFASEKLQVEKPKAVDNSTRNATKSIEGRKHLNVHNDRAQYLDPGNSVSNQILNHTATKLEEQGNSANGYQNETSHGGLGVRENAEEKNKSDSGQRVSEKLPYKMMNPEPTKGSVRETTNRGKTEEAPKTDGSKRVTDTALKHNNDTLKVSDNLNTSNVDPCRGQYIYIHKLPSRFNEDMVMNCKSLSKWLNMCDYITNYGLGPELDNTLPEFSAGGWFSTNQFALELIFHHRMNQYKCLTKDSSKASAIYIPHYSGLDVSRYLWHDKSLKDSAALDLVAWLREQDEWKRMWGRDHFFVAGRITWDFRREGDNLGNWGNKLMYLPESKNMTILTIESSPWHRNDFAVPYPSYFHPKTDDEIRLWQHKVRKMKRKYLFSFAGGLRPNLRNDVRGAIFNQCEAAKHKCSLLECVEGDKTCYEPANLMNLFESSVFCLQPPGDSFTRRSTFDSILAGCIPVFFHPGSAYVQYLWHFPRDFGKYSVYIPGKDVKERGVSIERVLSDIPREKVVAMREELIRLIPRITYVYPRFGVKTYEDAFDVAVNGVLERVEVVRKEMEEGKNSSFGFEEEESWKWFRQGRMGKNVWDDLFDRDGDMKFIAANK